MGETVSDKPKNISVEVEEGEFSFRGPLGLRKYYFKAEIHRDDGSWSYGLGKTKAEAIDDANRHLDENDPYHDWRISG